MQFQNLLEMVRTEVTTEYTGDSCIASVKVLSEVLHHFGYLERIDTFPILVQAEILNKVIAEAIVAKVPNPKEVEGAYGVGVGFDKEGKESIHLVLWLPKFACFLDPSIDQASRPEKNINLKPSAFVIENVEAWNKGEKVGWGTKDGAQIFYKRILGRKDLERQFKSSPNWGSRDRGTRRKLVGKIIRASKKESGE